MTSTDESGELPFLKGNRVAFEGDTRSELSGEHGAERLANQFQLMQRGLVYPAPFARFVSLWIKADADVTRGFIGETTKKVRDKIQDELDGANTAAVTR